MVAIINTRLRLGNDFRSRVWKSDASLTQVISVYRLWSEAGLKSGPPWSAVVDQLELRRKTNSVMQKQRAQSFMNRGLASTSARLFHWYAVVMVTIINVFRFVKGTTTINNADSRRPVLKRLCGHLTSPSSSRGRCDVNINSFQTPNDHILYIKSKRRKNSKGF